MAIKIKKKNLFAFFAIVLVIAVIIGFIQASSINDVENFKINNIYETSVDFSWHEVNSADGYNVYLSEGGKNDFKKTAEFKGKEIGVAQGKLENLEQSKNYDMYITAYKKHGKTVIESKKHKIHSFATSPSKQEIVLFSPDEGLLDVSWNENANATGYEIQYVLGNVADDKDFSQAQKTKIMDSSKSTIEFSNLEIEKEYSARIRSYINEGKDAQYGEWSDIGHVVISKKIQMRPDIDPSKPMIALTFDDGPGYNSASNRILDVFEKYGARATFFMVGKNAKDHPQNVKRKISLGCEIGNHTYNHKNYGKNVTPADISSASNAIRNAGGAAPTAFRSPGGKTTDAIRSECQKENMVLYYWSLDTEDWKYRDSNKVYDRVMKNVKDGDIILMHEIYDTTADAVERMVPELIKRGYQLVTCEELVRYKTGRAPAPGTQYVNATTIKNRTN